MRVRVGADAIRKPKWQRLIRGASMTYGIRIENPGFCDIPVDNVDESCIGDIVTTWCGRNTTIVVTQHRDNEEHGAEQ